jgi:hypothetical protein
MSDLHFFLNLYPLLPKNDTKKILNKFRLILTDWLLNGPAVSTDNGLSGDEV